jgi:NAD(P)-dependent dehydrogenase (short-subunit alcohol dehydrogenase family)
VRGEALVERMNLKNRTATVTGAANGIGRAIAASLAPVNHLAALKRLSAAT